MIIFTVEDIIWLALLGICIVIIAGFLIFGKLSSILDNWRENRKNRKGDKK